jgi:SynChlorMet cassette radical SAM/SPASM protein ScmF
LAVSDLPELSSIFFYITNSCNLSCAHCWLSREKNVPSTGELTTAEIMDIIDQAMPLGLREIKISGGEPFIRDDIPDIVEYADELGLTSRIETNATLLGEDAARRLGGSRGLRFVAVSLDGASAVTHARLRGSTGSYHAALRGIEYLVRHDIRVEVITSLHRHNLHDIEDIIALVAGLGASGFKINPVVQLGRGQEMADRGDLLSLEEVLDLNRRLDNGLGDRFAIPVFMSVPVAFRSLTALRRQGLGGCGVLNLLGVLPNGELSICGIGETHTDLVFGHARKTPLKEVWEGSPVLDQVRKEIALWPTGVCQRCMVRRYCRWGYCRAEAYALLGSLSAPPSFCQTAHQAGCFPASRLLPERVT